MKRAKFSVCLTPDITITAIRLVSKPTVRFMSIKKVIGTLKINTAVMYLSLSYKTPGVLRERLVALVAKEPRDRDSLSRFSGIRIGKCKV